MKIVTVSGASHYTRGSGRNRKEFAQVTILTGEGSNRRSTTRHAEYRPGYGYIGLNPNERAIPLNKQYEANLTGAKSDLAGAEASLADLQKRLDGVDGQDLSEKMKIVAKETLADEIEMVENDVHQATSAVEEAKNQLEIVRQELPLEVEFVGPGLTN